MGGRPLDIFAVPRLFGNSLSLSLGNDSMRLIHSCGNSPQSLHASVKLRRPDAMLRAEAGCKTRAM